MSRHISIPLSLFAALVLCAPTIARLAGGGADDTLVRSDGQRVDLGGGRVVRVLESGDAAGSPVVLVHGLPSNVDDWGNLPEALAGLGHRVIYYDRIGYGRSSAATETDDEFTYGSNARDLLALLDRLAIPRAALVGWSYGGGIVQLVAERAPERVAQIVLVASVGPHMSDADEAPETDLNSRIARSAVGPPLFEWVLGAPPLARMVVSASLTDAFSGSERVSADWIERTRAQLARPGALRTLIEEERRADPSVLHPGRIAVPALVLQGDADRLVSPRTGESLRAQLPNATLDVIEGGSHMLPVTHTALLASRMHEWMATSR